MELWIARDKSGDLYLYKDKPKRRYTTFDSNTGWTQWTFPSTFSEITWENSPQKVELKLIEKWLG